MLPSANHMCPIVAVDYTDVASCVGRISQHLDAREVSTTILFYNQITSFLKVLIRVFFNINGHNDTFHG